MKYLLWAAVLLTVGHILHMGWFFTHASFVSDNEYYLAVGRSLLNGFHLYTDMFESKPPIIFYLTKISLGMNMPTLYMWLQVALLLSLGPTLWFLYRKPVFVLLGLTVALETLLRSAAFQPEGFAAVLSIFSILLFTKKKYVLAGVTLGIAAMIKEPFIGSTLIGMLIFTRSWKDLQRIGIILLIGGVTSIAILILSGALIPYFTVYLPEMLTGRSVSGLLYPDFANRLYYVIQAPLWLRALNIWKLFTSLPVLFSIFLFLCLGLFPKRNLLSFSFLSVFIFCAYKVFFLYELTHVIEMKGYNVPWSNPLLFNLVLQIIIPVILLGIFVFLIKPPFKTLILVIVTSMGLFFTVLLVVYGFASGNEYGQYMGFAMPPILALSIYCLQKADKKVLISLSSLLILNAFIPNKGAPQVDYYTIKDHSYEQWTRAAASLDALMDSCHYQRYFFAEREPQFLFAFTKHSPYQITYGQQRALGAMGFMSSNSEPNTFFKEKYQKDLQETQIIVALPTDDPFAEQDRIHSEKILTMDPDYSAPVSKLPQEILPTMKTFTLLPPACASTFKVEGLKIYFRQ